ncbi:potassium transporter Trk [Microbacterium sp. SS28]|uniref:potassium transporter Trk n=1 Tax=Microbacterium sp. SS28 TaxID=2919948 RepID=UPI001FAA7E62|nr:potassium transporter Trk [Microbacterium sp. SS28]
MADKPNTPEMPEPEASAPPETVVEDHLERVRVRRAPKFSVFVVAGGLLGLLTALILTFAYDGTVNQSPNTGLVYSSGQVFGFLALICVAVGIALFGVLAIILDRRSSKSSREVTVDRETVQRLPEV